MSASARIFFRGCDLAAYKQLDSEVAKRGLKSWLMGHGVVVEKHITGCIVLSKALFCRSISGKGCLGNDLGCDFFLSVMLSSVIANESFSYLTSSLGEAPPEFCVPENQRSASEGGPVLGEAG
jgi:hypothetical protein